MVGPVAALDLGSTGRRAGDRREPVPARRGRRVVVTRARAQASELADRLASLGATVVELPVIAIEDPADGGAPCRRPPTGWSAGRTSGWRSPRPTPCPVSSHALGGRAVPAGARWAAVGTGHRPRPGRGRLPPRAGAGAAVSEALAAAFPRPAALPALGAGTGSPVGRHRPVPPGRAWSVARWPAGSGPRAGQVDEVVAYRTVAGAPRARRGGRRRSGRRHRLHLVVDGERTVELLGPDGVPPVVVSIGPVTSGIGPGRRARGGGRGQPAHRRRSGRGAGGGPAAGAGAVRAMPGRSARASR